MTEFDARTILQEALSACQADEAVLLLRASDEGSTRFANNAITQAVARSDASLTIRVAYGNRVGTAQTNRLTGETMVEAVRRAEEIAKQAEPDTEYMPPVEPSPVPPVCAWDDAVAAFGPSQRADAVRDVIGTIRSRGLTAAGSLAAESSVTAVLNSRGHFAFHRETGIRLVCTAMAEDSSGWASSGSHRLDNVQVVATAERAAEKAAAGRKPKSIEAKPYTVILEPAAAAELLAFVAWSLDAKAADEGRSAFTGKLGSKLGVSELTIASVPDHPVCPGSPFAADGMPSPTVHWVRSGVLENLAHSRYWAAKMNRPYTGSPTNIIVDGRDATVDDMIQSTERGLLVTRFWYIRFVDPMKLLLTGMTRDGLFLIEDGRVVSGVKNLRFNESPLRMFERIVALGQPEAVRGYGAAYVPPMKVDEFAFSSTTAF